MSARTGLPQAEAEKRVNDVITEAKNYAEAARKFTRASLLWLTLSLFLGAFSASLAAIEGGQLRDGRWKGVMWRGGYRTNNRRLIWALSCFGFWEFRFRFCSCSYCSRADESIEHPVELIGDGAAG